MTDRANPGWTTGYVPSADEWNAAFDQAAFYAIKIAFLPFSGASLMTVGTAYGAGRAIGILNSAPDGVAKLQFLDGSAVSLPLRIGWQVYPFAVTQIVADGTSASGATFYNLK